MDRQGADEHRRRLMDGLSGRVVEVGAGEGGNFAHYPAEVSEVVAVEPEPYLRAKASSRAQDVTVSVRVVDGSAERLPVEDRSADAVVASLVLCSVTDQQRALSEACRVLRPGGELRFYEHVAAPGGSRLARVQRVADLTLWPLLMGGCHVGRDTATAIATAGFDIEEIDRFDFPPDQPSPASPHILGRAVRVANEGGMP
ncbi:methyltransferase family protein [Kribbella sp. VKM Ac-2527]|uniref:Methyltransferase family protein n=2 Tax=Kribbella caucasensis TaxID=2512215 RepID=A0A4R6JHG0_9ACTN|nr:methyltransferase family protein [Kribbella sp. VKM Ac-2527]